MNLAERDKWAEEAARSITHRVLSDAAQGDDAAKAAMAKAELQWRLDEAVRCWRETLGGVKTAFEQMGTTVKRAMAPLQELTRAFQENNDEQ